MDAFFGCAKKIIHQVRLPGRIGNDGVGEPVGFPIERRHKIRRSNALDRTADEFLHLQLCFGAGTGPGEQFGHDNLDAFLLREPDVVNGHPAEIMDEIGGLCVVPPTDKFDLEAKGLQRCPRLFNLDLPASVRQGEGKRAINENLHFGTQLPPNPHFNAATFELPPFRQFKYFEYYQCIWY